MCAAVCLQEAAVQNAPLFLRYLTDQLHERVPGSLVLWYDSVIDSGQLKWQNELNQSNRYINLLSTEIYQTFQVTNTYSADFTFATPGCFLMLVMVSSPITTGRMRI